MANHLLTRRPEVPDWRKIGFGPRIPFPSTIWAADSISYRLTPGTSQNGRKKRIGIPADGRRKLSPALEKSCAPFRRKTPRRKMREGNRFGAVSEPHGGLQGYIQRSRG